MSSSMSSTSSDDSYFAPQKFRLKRYPKFKSRKHSRKIRRNKSCAASSSFDASLPSYSSEPATSSCEYESETNCQNNKSTISSPSSLGIKIKPVTPSERQERWQIVAEQNKELLETVDIFRRISLKDIPLSSDFKKIKNDPDLRRSVNLTKSFFDKKEDSKPFTSSKAFPPAKDYDDYLKNFNICRYNEELSNWLKKTKKKGRTWTMYKNGPLAVECLLPMDCKKHFHSDDEHPSLSDTGLKEGRKRKLPAKTKSVVKKRPKSTVRKQCSTKKPISSEESDVSLPYFKPFDDNLNESHDSLSEADSVEIETIENAISTAHAPVLQIPASNKGFSESLKDTRTISSSDECVFPVAELSNCEHTSRSTICLKKKSKLISVKKSKSSDRKSSLTIKRKSSALQSSAKKYKLRESKFAHECKETDSSSSEVAFCNDQCLKVVLPKLPIGGLSSASGNVKCAMVKNTIRNHDNGNGNKMKFRLLSHKHIINDLPFATIFSR